MLHALQLDVPLGGVGDNPCDEIGIGRQWCQVPQKVPEQANMCGVRELAALRHQEGHQGVEESSTIKEVIAELPVDQAADMVRDEAEVSAEPGQEMRRIAP